MVLCVANVRDNLGVIQIIVPYKLRAELLKLAYNIPSSGYLGVIKNKDRLLLGLVVIYW